MHVSVTCDKLRKLENLRSSLRVKIFESRLGLVRQTISFTIKSTHKHTKYGWKLLFARSGITTERTISSVNNESNNSIGGFQDWTISNGCSISSVGSSLKYSKLRVHFRNPVTRIAKLKKNKKCHHGYSSGMKISRIPLRNRGPNFHRVR